MDPEARELRPNGFVEWTHNGGQRGRHSSTLSAPLWPTHGHRWTSWALGSLTVAAACSCIAGLTLAQGTDMMPAPWRRSHITLVQLCFDRLDNSAPKRLLLEIVSDGLLGASGIELHGFTLAGRPVYLGSARHPLRYRSILVRLPNIELWARIDRPHALEEHIDVWRDVPVVMCTADPRAGFKMLGPPPYQVESAPCPDLGLRASLKIASSSEFAIEQIHLRTNGVKTFNGLRGCSEYVHGPAK